MGERVREGDDVRAAPAEVLWCTEAAEGGSGGSSVLAGEALGADAEAVTWDERRGGEEVETNCAATTRESAAILRSSEALTQMWRQVEREQA